MDNPVADKATGKEWDKWIDDDAVRRDQFRLIYDYIKFHITLYLSTPAIIGFLGTTLGATGTPFKIGLTVMISLYLIAGVHAAWFMGTHINRAWTKEHLTTFADDAFSQKRRILHHWLYWLGLASALLGLLLGLLWAKE